MAIIGIFVEGHLSNQKSFPARDIGAQLRVTYSFFIVHERPLNGWNASNNSILLNYIRTQLKNVVGLSTVLFVLGRSPSKQLRSCAYLMQNSLTYCVFIFNCVTLCSTWKQHSIRFFSDVLHTDIQRCQPVKLSHCCVFTRGKQAWCTLAFQSKIISSFESILGSNLSEMSRPFICFVSMINFYLGHTSSFWRFLSWASKSAVDSNFWLPFLGIRAFWLISETIFGAAKGRLCGHASVRKRFCKRWKVMCFLTLICLT